MSKKEGKFQRNLSRFKLFLDVIRGKEDARERFSFLFSPENIKTTSRLTRGQAEFVADAYFVAKYFPEAEPIRDLAREIAESACSVKGARVDAAIRFQQASKGAQGTNVGIFQGIRDRIKGKDGKETEQ